MLLGGDETFTVQELGLLSPTPLRTKALFAGQVCAWLAAWGGWAPPTFASGICFLTLVFPSRDRDCIY